MLPWEGVVELGDFDGMEGEEEGEEHQLISQFLERIRLASIRPFQHTKQDCFERAPKNYKSRGDSISLLITFA
jgi:hypothetical protein